MRISDWSSDVCSSDLPHLLGPLFGEFDRNLVAIEDRLGVYIAARGSRVQIEGEPEAAARARDVLTGLYNRLDEGHDIDAGMVDAIIARSEEHTSELQSLMRISYAVFCLKKKNKQRKQHNRITLITRDMKDHNKEH